MLMNAAGPALHRAASTVRSGHPAGTSARLSRGQPGLDAALSQQLDVIHAQLGDGFAPAESLAAYLAFLETIPHGMRFDAKVTVALALIDNVLAMDELKLEERKLRRALDAVESATYDLLVRIGRRHGQLIGHTAA